MTTFDKFFQHDPSIQWILDSNLLLIGCSSACLPLLASPDVDSLCGQPLPDVLHPLLDPDWIAQLQEYATLVVAHGQPMQYDTLLSLPGGSQMYAQAQLSPVVGQEGCAGVHIYLHDVTQWVLRAEKAEEDARARSRFLGNIGHEVRTPMNAIKGLSELLALTRLDEQQRNYVHNIISSTNSLISIISDVLDLSRMDARDVILLESDYALAELITDACHIVSQRADEKGLPLLIDVPADMPARFHGDSEKIRRILVNLLSNAIKYTPEGHARLQITWEDRQGGPWLVCHISDTGIGIRQEDLPTLFEAFSSGNPTTRRSIAGTGLGLAISKRLVDAMRGELTVQSTLGQGSTFSFAIPQPIVDTAPLAAVAQPEDKRVLVIAQPLLAGHLCAMLDTLHVPCACLPTDRLTDPAALPAGSFTHCLYASDLPDQPVAALQSALSNCTFTMLCGIDGALYAAQEGRSILLTPLSVVGVAHYLNTEQEVLMAEQIALDDAPQESFQLQHAQLLVVDDNKINLIVCAETLQLFGAEVVTADSGEEALALASSQAFDAIFLDHIMPGMDGLEVARRLRSQPGPNQAAPLIALTANVDNADSHSVYTDAGMDDLLGKPFEFADLARVLMRWMPLEKIRM